MNQKEYVIALLADVHLMRSQYGNPRRRRQIKRSLMQAIEAAHAFGAETILCAGDFLDSNTPGADVAANDIPDIYERLVELDMTMYCIQGNHDDIEPSWINIIGSTVENIIPTFAGTGIKCVADGKKFYMPNGISVLGYDFGNRERIKTLATNGDCSGADIVMLHGEVKEWVGFPSATAVSIAEFNFHEGMAPQIVLIGDTHVHKIHAYGTTYFISPGSTDYCSKTELNEPKRLSLARFRQEGETWKCVGISEMEYEHTIAVEYTLNTAEDVAAMVNYLSDNKDAIMRQGMLLYVTYNQDETATSVSAIRKHLQDLGIAEDVTLQAQPIATEAASSIQEKIANARTIKDQPDSFFMQNKKLFFTEERSPEFIELCGKILNSKDDSKKVLDDYISNKLDTVILS